MSNILNYKGNVDLDTFISDTYDQVVKSLQKFILKLQTSLRLMYAKTINYQCFIEEKDEFINLICSLLFSNHDLYITLYELYTIRYKHDYDILNKKMKIFENINPEDLCIKQQFCLNQKTADLKENLKKKSTRISTKQFNKNIKTQKKMTTEQPTTQTYESLQTIVEAHETVSSKRK